MFCLVSGLIAFGISAAGQTEHWVATSDNALAITGNVTFSPPKVIFQNGRSLPLRLLRPMADFDDLGERVNATIYQVTTPSDFLLLNGNYLCGGPPPPELATYVVVRIPQKLPADLSPVVMAVFSGKDLPKSDASETSCGGFQYDAR